MIHALMVAASFLFIAVVLFVVSSRPRAGMHGGEVIYQDMTGPAQVLRSYKWGIAGKPDSLLRLRRGLIRRPGIVPVEFKHSSKAPRDGSVHASHAIQVIAYCALVEDQMRERVPYGLVIYAGQEARRVEYNRANQAMVD